MQKRRADTSLNNEGTQTYIQINSARYRLTHDAAHNTGSLSLNSEITAYLDVFGRIAYCEAGKDSYTYGFLYKLVEDENEEDMLIAKLYGISGEFLSYNTSNKIKIDGDRASGIDGIYSLLSRGTGNTDYYQLIRYTLDSDNKINNIDTVYRGTNETNNTLSLIHQGYSNKREVLDTLVWKPRGGSFEGQVLYDSSVSKFMTVPKNYSGDRDYFYIGKAMSEDDKISLNAYVSTEDQLMPDVLLCYLDTDSGTAAAKVADTFFGVITDIKTQMNADKDVETVITFDAYGGTKSFIVEEKFNIDKIMPYSIDTNVKNAYTQYDNGVSDEEAPYKLSKGDFAEITVDSINRIIFARLIAEGSTGKQAMDSSEGGNIYNNRFIYGFMYKNDGNRFSVALGERTDTVSKDILRYYNTGSARVYRIKNARKMTVDKITMNDIVDYKAAGKDADRVVIYSSAGVVQIIAVYSE